MRARDQERRGMDRKRTNFDRSLAILIRSSATTALFTAHTQATVAPWSAHDGADGPLGNASWRRWRRDHGVPHGVAETPRTGGNGLEETRRIKRWSRIERESIHES